jgi:hypothetical protein
MPPKMPLKHKIFKKLQITNYLKLIQFINNFKCLAQKPILDFLTAIQPTVNCKTS